MECDDYGKKDKEREAYLMDDGFDILNFRRFHSAKGREKRRDEESSAVQRRKRQEVERAQVDGKKGRDGKDDRDAHLGGYELYEKASYGDGSTHTLRRLGTLGRSLGGDEFTEKFEKEFEREGDLIDGLLPGNHYGLAERIPVFETFFRLDIGIRNVRTDLSFLRKNGHFHGDAFPGNPDLDSVGVARMRPNGCHETLGRGNFTAFDLKDPVTLENPRDARRAPLDRRNGNSGNLENSQLDRTVETRNEERFGTGLELGVHGERRDALPKKNGKDDERENEIERDAREDDERFREIGFGRERVLVRRGGTEFVFALQSDEPSNRQVIERVLAPLRVLRDDRGLRRNADSEFLDLDPHPPRGEKMSEFMENDYGEKYREGDDDAEKYVHAGKSYESERDPLSGIPLRNTDTDWELLRVRHLGLHVVEEVVDEIGEKFEVFALGSEILAVRLDTEASVELALLVFFER